MIPSVLAVAEVDVDGVGPARITLRLLADRDLYTWYDDAGVSQDVGGTTVEDAIKAASAAWQGWGFKVMG